MEFRSWAGIVRLMLGVVLFVSNLKKAETRGVAYRTGEEKRGTREDGGGNRRTEGERVSSSGWPTERVPQP